MTTRGEHQRAESLPARFIVLLINGYQVFISPVLAFFGTRCRHHPSCSEYGVLAVKKHGAWRGFWLTLSRFSRCHPFGSHGWDPPPEHLAPAGWRAWRYGDWSWHARSAKPEEIKPKETTPENADDAAGQ